MNIGNQNVQVQGNGEPLLLVHGFPLDHTMWQHQIDQLSAVYQVIAPDLPGFGRSEGSDADVVLMQDFAGDLEKILDALQIQQPVHFCGLSMGGYIAWQFYKQSRNRLKSMILCDTKAAADSLEARENRYAAAEKVLTEGSEFMATGMVEKLFASSTVSNKPKVVQSIQEVIRATAPRSIAAALKGMAAREDVTQFLPSIDLPVLLIVGKHDILTTPEEMHKIAEGIPNANCVTIPGAGHMAPLEQPETVNATILEFLSQLT